jgi:two-component system response regulator WspF
VIWVARDGVEAVALCANRTPDVVLMDLLMPNMDGVEATRRIMAETPCAIIVVTASVDANASRTFEAMGYGALDAVDVPTMAAGNQQAGAARLLAKLARVGVLIGAKTAPLSARTSAGAETTPLLKLVAIGASAGGPGALSILLAGLPASFSASVVIIQHIDEKFVPGMVEWLRRDCALPVSAAREGERPTTGSVYLACSGDHLTLKAEGTFGYTAEPRDYSYRPSVDAFFQSVLRHWQGEAVGVLLTGMGDDGAVGLKALRDNGYYTIAQDKDTSAVYGMPKAAAALGAAVDILPISRIAPKLASIFASNHPGRGN